MYAHSTPAKDRSRARHWFFTENNPIGNLDVVFEGLLDGIIDYATWQLEIGENGTVHYQGNFWGFFVKLLGYVNFKKQTYFSTVAQILPKAHWQLCIDPAAARAYCQKPESRLEGPYEVGVWMAPEAKISVWKKMRDDILAGASDLQLLQHYPAQVFMYYRGITNVRQLVSVPRQFKTRVILIVGKPGTGKSRAVSETYEVSIFSIFLTSKGRILERA